MLLKTGSTPSATLALLWETNPGVVATSQDVSQW